MNALFPRHNRPRLGRALLSLAVCAMLAACGEAATPTTSVLPATATVPSGAANATMAPATMAPATATIGAAGVTQPQGELKIGAAQLTTGLTATSASEGFSLVQYGAAETLLRLDNQLKLQPWLAESYSNVDPSTWTVKLRAGVTFWDGSKLDAQSVIDSFKDSWAKIPSASLFISKDTQITAVDDLTLTFKTPQPAGDFPYSLATWYFLVHKVGANGAAITTGLYQPTNFVKDQQLTLTAFANHWDGPPPIKTITIKLVTDTNARALALQSGDLNFLYGLPPSIVPSFGSDIQTSISAASTRVHTIILNNSKPPFNDLTVRQATAMAIDRNALNTIALGGLGTVVNSLFPPNIGLTTIDAQHTDVAQAQKMLDDAGWKTGADGVRAKDGVRLAFTLYSYPGRAELTPMATAIQGQLKTLGYDVQVQEVADITTQIKGGDFQAAMYSINAAINGDPQYMFAATLIKGGTYNYGGYSNPQLETLFTQLQAEPDPARREALSGQMQQIVKADAPNIYLVSPPLISAFNKATVSGYTAAPNDLYQIDRNTVVK